MISKIAKIVLFIIASCGTLFPQQVLTVFGTVSDENNKPLPYVNVYRLSSFDGVMTNEKGEFLFTTKKGEGINIVASIIGYSKYNEPLPIGIKDKYELNIVLYTKTVKLTETVVLGSAFSSEKGKGVVVQERDVLMTPGGAADILQAIKTMPGLTNVSESAQLYVRGGDPVETITVIDNATVYHPYTLESSYGGLFSNLNTGAMKSLFFSSGGFSAKYGNALSGVLDIKTKDEPSANSHTIGISMASLSFESDIPVIEDKTGLRLYGKMSLYEPLMAVNGARSEFTSLPDAKDISGVYTHKYSETGRIKLFGMYAEDNQGVKVERAEYNGNFNGASYNRFINLNITDVFYRKLFINTTAAYNVFANKWTLGVLDLENTDAVMKYRVDAEYNISKEYRLLAGFDMEERTEKYLGQVPDEDYNIRPDAPKVVLDEKVANRRYSTYLELESAKLFTDRLFFVAGLRYDVFPDLDISWFDPRLNIGYKINDKSNIKFGFGYFRQIPDLRLFAIKDGNPGLKEMQAEQYIVSYDYQYSKKSYFRIETYYKDYINLPLEDEVQNYSNNGYGYAYGADIIFKGDLSNDLSGWVSYGYLKSKRIWMDNESYAPSDYDITHGLTIVTQYYLTDSWNLGVNYKYSTGRPYTPVLGGNYIEYQGVYEPVEGSTNSSRFPGYHRLDVRFTYFHNLFGKYFTVVYLEMMNILNIRNIHSYTYSKDYNERFENGSYFGRRTLVLGTSISL